MDKENGRDRFINGENVMTFFRSSSNTIYIVKKDGERMENGQVRECSQKYLR